MLDANDLAKTYYGAARAEILQRLALREQVLLAGVTAFGVIVGIALNSKLPILLALLPPLSLAFTVVLFRHHFLISDLAHYVNDELGPTLGIGEQIPEGETEMPLHWDAFLWRTQGHFTTARSKSLAWILRGELLGAWLVLWGPGAAALAFLWARRQISWAGIGIESALLALALVPYAMEGGRLLGWWKKPVSQNRAPKAEMNRAAAKSAVKAALGTAPEAAPPPARRSADIPDESKPAPRMPS